jgi:SAM-dependent methyltransferase
MLVAGSNASVLDETEPFKDAKTEALASIIRERVRVPIRRLLVVGCGSGKEAAVLAHALNAEAVGIDLDARFDPQAARRVQLRRGDATRLEFPAEYFDFLFSFHVLEHIPEYPRAIAEMHRVLAPRAAYCIGTPNRQRLVGYIGSKEASWGQKIAWNKADWQARLKGRFRNEFGAHAGFASAELRSALAKVFRTTDEITDDYYRTVYSRYEALIRFISLSGMGRFLFPAVYFMGER